jgi:hypothetical protein
MRPFQSLVATGVLLAGALAVPSSASGASAADFVTSGDCARERGLVRRALERSTLRVDVSGDGRLDKVAVATDHDAGKRCRAFVGVRVRGGSTYSTHLYRGAVPPKGARATIAGLPTLGDRAGAEIVVDTHARTDSVLAQMFTLTGKGLRRVHLAAFEDGTFVVEGGGVTYPRGARCTADGDLHLSMASQVEKGKRYEVTRHTYDMYGGHGRFRDVVVKAAAIPSDRLVERFPEFARPHWKACTGTVRR